VREGVVKHSHFQTRPSAQEFDTTTYPCLEAQIVDLADEIAYLAHDVDDGLKAQMLSVEELNASGLFRESGAAARDASPAAEMRVLRYQTVIRMIDAMSTDLMTNLAGELERNRIRSVEEVRKAGRALVAFGPAMGPKVDEIKQVMRDRLYRHYRVSRMTEKAGRVLAALFKTYMTEPRQMPEHVVARAERYGEPISRAVADYIAGMTDRFALDEYRKLFDPNERV
jgi:dGTPase